MVASTSPGKPNMMRKPRLSIPPNQPPSPQQDQRYADHHGRDRERQVDHSLQGNPCRELATDEGAVAMPKTTFSGTTIATMIRLSCAEMAAGVVIQSQNWPKPCSKERQKISDTGTTSRMNR